MNILHKIYCRTFQLCFRVALPFLPYREPAILNNFTEITSVLEKKGINKVLLVTDKGISSCGLLEGLLQELNHNQITCTVFDETVPNPTIDNIEKAREIYLKDSCGAIIAFGGGCINDTIVHLATSAMGFGGVGNSGMGSYHGKKSFDTFSHEKSILKKYCWIDLPIRYQPYKNIYNKLIHFFLH